MNYPIVRIDWLDAQSGEGQAQPVEDVIDMIPVPSCSVGFLLHKDRTKVIISTMMFGECTKRDQLIPAGMITRMTEMQEKITKKPSEKMVKCKGCYHKIMPYNVTGYCYRCRRGEWNTETLKWEGGKGRSHKEETTPQ